MNKFIKKTLLLLTLIFTMSITVFAEGEDDGQFYLFRKPYDKPELVTISASQTAFLIPLTGDSTDQASFQSEELLAQAKVATKQVQIPHRWLQTGRHSGKWIAAAKLIVVERTPETREWNSTSDSGTSSKNQAVYAESKESIGFSVGINISAQIWDEDDAVKFLYSYNNKTLESIMDTEIRARVETDFVEKCAKYSMEDILLCKEEIMNYVREDVVSYFSDKGITITNIGMKDGVEYDNQDIQNAINEKFSSAQKLTTQQNNNAVAISKAEAEKESAILKAQGAAEALEISSTAEAEANKRIAESLTPEFVEYNKTNRYMDKWDGSVPTVQTGESTSLILDVGNVTTEEVEE